jgi:gamma-glutamyltranspeptidase/glutathione hydrolase
MPRDATGAAVSAGSGTAAEVAMDVVRRGGNAVDAAIAGSAAQCVVEMPWCGLGGDAFALIRTADGDVVAFNGSGAAPAAAWDVTAGLTKVPRFGPLSVAVPAIVDAWAELNGRLGSMPLADLLEPARRLAGDGFALDERLARTLAHAPTIENGDQLVPLVDGQHIVAGERFRQPELAESLAAIAAEGRDAMYHGELGKRIADHVAAHGGALALDDLIAHVGDWAPPRSVVYRGVRVSSNGLVSSGVLLLLALSVLQRVWPDRLPASELEVNDTLVRLKGELFGSVAPLLGDPRHGAIVDVLDDEVVDRITAALVARSPSAAHESAPPAADTTSLAVAAPDGSTVCFIHSLFNEFGSRELVPGTGVVLNDRLANLVVAGEAGRSRPNALVPGRRPLHTLHGYLAEWPDGRVVAGATPGGRGQVQTNAQVLLRLIDREETLQAAVSAPRWVHGLPRSSADDQTLYLEPDLTYLEEGLGGLGHSVEVVDGEPSDRFGNCTVVARHGVHLEAAADHRRGGRALVE